MKNLYKYVMMTGSVNTLKSKETRTSYEEDTIPVTLRIKSLSTLSDAIHAAGTRFKETKDMTK